MVLLTSLTSVNTCNIGGRKSQNNELVTAALFFLLLSSCASHLSHTVREMSSWPRLAHKVPIMQARIFLEKVVYMVLIDNIFLMLGSSYLTSQLGRSQYKENPSARDKYEVWHVNGMQNTYRTRLIHLLGSSCCLDLPPSMKKAP